MAGVAAHSSPLDGTGPSAVGGKKKASIVNLPREAQLEIVSRCSNHDLVNLSLVSRHFCDLAATRLYRDISAELSGISCDESARRYLSLASQFDTLATSERDPAQHMKRLCVDFRKESHRRAAQCPKCSGPSPSVSDKLLNTVLLVVLRKAVSLESFRWSTGVELSPAIYNTLQRISSLKDFHVRMQIYGHSWKKDSQSAASSSTSALTAPQQLAIFQTGPLTNAVFGPQISLPDPQPTIPPPTRANKSVLSGQDYIPHLSGFRNLRSLGVLDIDNLQIADELATCLANSTLTIKKLQLSFCDSLAARSRRVARLHDVDSDATFDSDSSWDSAGPSLQMPTPDPVVKEQVRAKAAQERQRQEAALGKILGVDATSSKKAESESPSKDEKDEKGEGKGKGKGKAKDDGSSGEPGASGRDKDEAAWIAWQSGLRSIVSQLWGVELAEKEYSERPSQASPQLKAALLALAGPGTEKAKAPGAEPQPVAGSSKPTGEARGDAEDANTSRSSTGRGASVHETVARLASRITADAFVERLSVLENEAAVLSTWVEKLCDEPDNADPHRALSMEKMAGSLEQKSSELIKDAVSGISESDLNQSSVVSDYVMSTRGFQLEELTIHLIPVKASVLSRAIDLHVLRSLTLLNVGNQKPIWRLLRRENSAQPLQLREVFTDHASKPLLKFLSELPELHDLLLLERAEKHWPASFAPKTKVSLGQIRRMVLRKHMATIKRLMIKDESKKLKWDLDETTVSVICRGGSTLEELAVGMDIKAVHCFNQYLGGLESLCALHIVHFDNSDTCLFVHQEAIRFIVDTAVQHPQMKLKWVAMEASRFEMLVRVSQAELDARAERQDVKRERGDMFTMALAQAAGGGESGDDSDAESTDLYNEKETMSKVIMDGSKSFHDATGVRIFQWEVRSGLP